MIKNSLGDLNGYLFEQLERLNVEEMSEDELKHEINRSKAVTEVASRIIATGDLVLKGKMAYDENLQRDAKKPGMLEG